MIASRAGGAGADVNGGAPGGLDLAPSQTRSPRAASERAGAGRDAYASARRSETYEQWPYRHVLKDHKARAEALAVALRAGEEEMMINSSHGCVGCHS